MKFKFKIILVFVLLVSLALFTSCSQNEGEVEDEPEESIETEEPVGEVEEPQESESDDDEDISNGDEPVSSETEEFSEEDIMIDSGTYVGRIDNNHIEIKISGVPEEISAKAFKLDAEIRDDIEEHISPEDQVKFEYYLNEDDVGVIIKIEKIEN